ncbi:hypothetical protein ALC57_11774 [Trachymyrmex cornetzi]|uniref:Uncharacterized protein n=1 Tax=Trachymyrmex cornetzi TaxID=471704 RepID=A0A151J209_9HYME|nr:hypothetical protein ALC57_11774 [Trachymyrmex cornetzi]
MENLKRRKEANRITHSFVQLLTETGLPKSSVHEMIKQNRYHPYKMTKIQFLIFTNPEILQNLLWTNECKFSNNDIINRCNHHFWLEDNSHWFQEHNFQQKITMNVWCDLVYDYLIGPYFYEQNLTAQAYLNFLRSQLPTNLFPTRWLSIS